MQNILRTDRRLFLVSAGITTLAVGGLSACGGSDQAPPSASGGSSSSESGASAGPGGVEVALSDVPEGGGTILTDADFVVTQPNAGEYKAFSKICTHQGCPVSEVKDAQIVCFCHGSEFSISDGSVTQGPATKPLPAATVTVDGSSLFIS